MFQVEKIRNVELTKMQQYFIKWKMRAMFYSSIDFYETLEYEKN